ncbi:uncharacterized protein LOC144377207 [Ictidomys tridecemlineatus]
MLMLRLTQDVLYPCCEAEEAWPQDQLPLSPAPCPCLYPQPGAEEAPALSSQEIKAACAVDSRESKARRQWIKELARTSRKEGYARHPRGPSGKWVKQPPGWHEARGTSSRENP